MLLQTQKQKNRPSAKDPKGKDSTELKKPDTKYLNKALQQQEELSNRHGSMDVYYDSAPIRCKVSNDITTKSPYISAPRAGTSVVDCSVVCTNGGIKILQKKNLFGTL